MTITSFSARETFYFWQKAVIGLLLCGCLVGLFTIGPTALILPLFLYVILTLILCTHILYLVLLSSIRSVDRHSIIDLITSNKDNAPLYTILVPLYQESQMLPKLIDNLLKLDYPTDKLEIILLLEADDEETRAAVANIQIPSHFQVMIVPNRGPRTKARACNIGLDNAHGEYLVIYDAEDQPDRDQLWKALTAFQQSDDSIACVQSRLSFYNPRQNLLTRLFTLEYTFWFDLFLPALSIIGAPIPLGGSSNHLRTSILKKIGGWDAYNVTEDCDLGIRLAKGHHRTIIINSTTLEEANSQIGNWIRQRSRWIKGYLQTYLVHTRDKGLLRKLGLQNFLFFQLYIGGMPLLLLLAPLFWMLTLIWNLGQGHILGWYFPPVLYLLSLASIVLSVLALLSCGLSSAVARRNYDLIKDLALFPFYIFIFYIAAWKGCIQLFTRPHYWEKTKHGLG
jgi:glycosyltransferase XagB